jgi:hypothetical protein
MAGDLSQKDGQTAKLTVELSARALDWVEVATDPVIFDWMDPRTQQASLVLSNTEKEPLEIMLEAKPALEHEARVQINPGGSLSVPLRWRGDSVPSGWGTLLLTSKTGMQRVVVWSLDAALSGFGAEFVLSGNVGSCSLRRMFANTGGRSGVWTFRCKPPFYLADAEKIPKVAPEAETSQPRGLPLSKAPEVRLPIPGFVWDHNLNRYVPGSGAAKAAAPPKPEIKSAPAATPQAPKAVELTRRLQPGESFILFVGLSGAKPAADGTLSVNGPGQSREEPLLVMEHAGTSVAPPSPNPGVPPMAKAPSGAVPLPEAAKAMPSGLPAMSQAGETPPSGALPRLFEGKAAMPKPQQPTKVVVAQQLVLPSLFLDGFRVSQVTSDSATISFPAGPGVAPEDLWVRYRRLSPLGEGDQNVEWLPFAPADRVGRRIGPNIEIRLRGLQPGESNHIDLIGPPSPKGKRSKLYQTEILTLPAPAVFSPKRPWFWTALVSLLGTGYLVRRRFQ